MTIRIVTDSTCDLDGATVAEYDIRVVPLFINMPGGSYLDGVEISREEFYRQLPACNPAPTTAAPGPDAFKRVYDDLADQGASGVLTIHISEKLSGVMNSVRVGAEQTTSVPVTVVDSGQLTMGLGYLVEAAAQAARAGRTMVEIMDQLREQMTRTYVFAALDTLEFLKRSGRMNKYVAGLGELLQLKPLLRMHLGEPIADKVRTTSRAIQRVATWLGEISPVEKVTMVHTHVPERAEAVLEVVRGLLPGGPVASRDVTPVLGAHLGPGAVGFACVSAAAVDPSV